MEAKQSQVLNLERVKALETWLKTTNTKLTQVNGQRKYGGPPEVWDGPTPGAHCEVFISQIPRDVYEDHLIPLFSSVGPLWEFRLMMNFSGQNRGFAYAKYSSSDVAAAAIRVLHGHMVEPGSCICVRRSTEKRHLCIGELPSTTRQEDLLKVLRLFVEGVERVSLKAGPGIQGVSAIVAFSSHHTASMAKKILAEVFKKQYALSVSIKWHSSVKLGTDEPVPQKKPTKSLLTSPSKSLCYTENPAQHFGLSPHLAFQSLTPAGFCKAVGGPPAPPNFSSYSSSWLMPSSQGNQMFVASPAMHLHEICELTGVGQPIYEMHYSHAGSDGFLYFLYTVSIPKITVPFKGLVMILPGPTGTSVLEEARQAAAQHILQKIYSHKLTQ